jgi:hypothetical protein
MPTLKGGYYQKDGTRVPSVTTVLGRFKDAGGLIHWAWKEGCEGRDYRETRDSAASVGTYAHALVESYIQKLPPPTGAGLTTDQQRLGQTAFKAFQSWVKNNNIVFTRTEVSLVSELYGFGGTPDAIGMSGTDRVLLDWKSGAVYSDALCQVAAYAALWNENYPSEPITGGFHIIRFGKESGDFVHRYYPELNHGWEMFQTLLKAYYLDKILKARAK